MKTQHKLLVILLITAVLFFAGFLIFLNIQEKQNEILINAGIEQQRSILETAIKSKSEVISLTTYDYTYWDDFVNYIERPTHEFAESNLYSLFNSFNINYVGVFNLSKKPVFNAFQIDSVELLPFIPAPEVFSKLADSNFIKYYKLTDAGLLEIHGATIHSTADEARNGSAYGFFFMAKLIDSSYLKSLKNLTGGMVELVLESNYRGTPDDNTITTAYPLEGWDGKTLGLIELKKVYDFLSVSKRLSTISIWFLATLAFVILIIFFLSFNVLVNIPLSKISHALITKSRDDRQKLLSLNSEFKKIGALIEDYFGQQEKLEKEIEVRKETEAQKEKLITELDTANRELKDFAYIVSHDLKAPLRAIGSISQWIHADYSDKLDDDGKMQLDLLLSRVHRMQNLIEGILSYSRVTRVKEEKEMVDLNVAVKEAIEMVSPPEKFKISVEENLPTVSYGPTHILQIFENLISNAVKYNNKENGEISIRCTENGYDWRISVSDNGPGIEEKYFEKIFQIFQTLQARDEFESTGIGLSIVKKIIENNGGRITVDSTPGEGTKFEFIILK